MKIYKSCIICLHCGELTERAGVAMSPCRLLGYGARCGFCSRQSLELERPVHPTSWATTHASKSPPGSSAKHEKGSVELEDGSRGRVTWTVQNMRQQTDDPRINPGVRCRATFPKRAITFLAVAEMCWERWS